MLRRFAALWVVAALQGGPATAGDDLRMPPGTRRDLSGQLISGRGLRDTTDFIAKELARQGISATQVGPYRVRGVEITRFLSQTATTTWLAIHIVWTAGKTVIFLVPRGGS